MSISCWILRMLCFTGILVSVGCQQEEDPFNNPLLYQLPYQPITDSIKRHPSDPALYLTRGLLLSQHNRHETATADYRKAWELRSDEASGLEYSANLMLVNDTARAISLLQECRRLFPKNPEFNRRLSELLAATGKGTAAITEFDLLLSQDSLNFNAWHEKGMLQLRFGDTPGSLHALEQAYRLHPSSYTGLPLASLYAARLDIRVLTICNELLRQDSTSNTIDALFLKGVYYSDKKQYTQALQAFESCIRKDWKFPDAYIEKGLVYYEQQLLPKALQTFEMAARVSPTDADAYFWMGRCQESMHQDTEALLNYQRALTFDAALTEAKIRMANLKQKIPKTK